jgi:ferrochelatase
MKTGRFLAEALRLTPEQCTVTFQSRFGKAEWLQPYTAARLEELGRAKTKRLDVVCPGFVADGQETLEEIAMEGKATFMNAGGGDFRYIPALNTRPAWVSALADIALEQLRGWLPEAWSEGAEQEELLSRKQRAQGC